MKPRRNLPISMLLTAVATSGMTRMAIAANLYWDSDGSSSTTTGGSGTWTKTGVWRSGSPTGVIQSWVNGNDAFLPLTAGTITISSGTLSATSLNFTNTAGGYTINGAGTLIAQTINVAATGATQTINVALGGSNVTFNSQFTAGSTVLALGGANTFTGALVLGAGGNAYDRTQRIDIKSESSIPSASTPIIWQGNYSTLFMNFASTPASYTINNPISFNPDNLPNFVGLIGGIINNNLTINSAIAGSGDFAFGSAGGGSAGITLGAQNSWTGVTRLINLYATNNSITAGVVKLNINNALPTATSLVFGGPNGTAEIDGGALDLNGFNQKVASLNINTLGGTSASNGIVNTSGTTSTFTISGSASTTFSSKIGSPNYKASLSPGVDGKAICLTLDAANTGSLTLNNATNDYTGGTDIEGGTLVAMGTAASASLLGTGLITVGAGGTLAGTGQIIIGSAGVSVSGKLSPGGSAKVASFAFDPNGSGGGLTFSAGSSVNLDFLPTSHDLISVLGNLNLPAIGTITLNLNDPGSGLSTGSYPLLDYAGNLIGNIGSFSLVGAPAGAILSIGTDPSNGSNSILLDINTGTSSRTWTGAAGSGWNTTSANWTGGGSAFVDGDAVTFDDSGSNTTISVAAGGVIPSLMTFANNNKSYTINGPGSISGTGVLIKNGAGILTLSGANTISGGVSLNAGMIETTNPAALGTGPFIYGTGVTLKTTSDTTIAGGMTPSANGSITKTGTGNLILAGSPTAVADGAITILQGSLQLNSPTALGGSILKGTSITLSSSTQLILNTTGTRIGKTIDLNNATLTRPNGVTGTIDMELNSETGAGVSDFYRLTITGSSTVQNLDIATSTQSATNQYGLGIRMPVLITSGSTLTIYVADNTGSYGSHSVAFRGATNANSFADDAVMIQSGAILNATGPGETRFGSTTAGKPIIGQGSSLSDAVLKTGSHTYLTDLQTGGPSISKLVIQGTGTGGLRIEAPMNAVYNDQTPSGSASNPDPIYGGTTGFFGINTKNTAEGISVSGVVSIGNAYTVMSPKRYAELSDPFGSASTISTGTITLAATDAAGATGVIDNGPSSPTSVQLALDNTITSGALVYQINSTANGGAFANFGGLILKRSYAGTITTQLLSNTKIPSLTITGGTLDLQNHSLVINYAGVSPFSTISSYLHSGLIKTTAGNGAQTVGMVEASDLLGANGGIFAGMSVDGSAILLKYTWFGDLNFDGVINADDYALLDRGKAKHLTGWANGDVNYDGVINSTDYFLIDKAYGTQTGTLDPEFLATRQAQFGDDYVSSLVAAVPEPSVFLAFGIAFLLVRRRSPISLYTPVSSDI